ncbi:MAG: hypothetical protein NZM35_05060 [Chitinophagales bacterium]|nr:hypothetical protein [Chitinophagales bacterium]MDW8418592.1 hypothetical protein [Chitinophagales bacterium]
MVIQVALYVFWLLMTLLAISRLSFFRHTGIPLPHRILLFMLKVTAGIVLTLTYTYYYTDASKSDIWRYYTDSVIISRLFFSHPDVWIRVITGWNMQEPEVFRHILDTQNFCHPEGDIFTNNAFIIRLISLFNILTAENIYANTLLFSFIGYTGLTALYRVLWKGVGELPAILRYTPFFLAPGVVFWSAGLLKDAPVLAGMGLFLYCYTHKEAPWYIVVLGMLVAAWVICRNKLHILLTILPVLPIIAQGQWQIPRKYLYVWLGACILLAVILFRPIGDLLHARRLEFLQLANTERAGSLYSTAVYSPSAYPMMFILGFVNGFMQPTPWQAASVLQKLYGYSHFITMFFVICLCIRYAHFRKLQNGNVLFCFIFSVLHITIIGVVVPVSGALVHYRSFFMPFLLTGIIHILNLENIIYDTTLLRNRFVLNK